MVKLLNVPEFAQTPYCKFPVNTFNDPSGQFNVFESALAISLEAKVFPVLSSPDPDLLRIPSKLIVPTPLMDSNRGLNTSSATFIFEGTDYLHGKPKDGITLTSILSIMGHYRW
jgi:hypothetical protein